MSQPRGLPQGGPTLFAAEVEALLQIAKAGGSSWRFYEGEGANLAWALAASRHWSVMLRDLEEGLVQVGMVWCMGVMASRN